MLYLFLQLGKIAHHVIIHHKNFRMNNQTIVSENKNKLTEICLFNSR